MTEAPYFYPYLFGQGRGILADMLDAEDPFAVRPAEIVERMLAAGYAPRIDRMQREPFQQFGTTAEVLRDNQTFLVAVSRDAESVSVQEVRADAHPDE